MKSKLLQVAARAEELKGYYSRITYPQTEEWRKWKDKLMEGGLHNGIR